MVSTTLRLPWARKAEKVKREAVNRVISSFGLERFRNHRTNQLSTGTRRVVDLASIVLSEPRLLLLDEPTAGIAQREAEAFIPLLRRLQEVTHATILLVEHDVPLVFELCSRGRDHGDRQGRVEGDTGRGESRSPGARCISRCERGGASRIRSDPRRSAPT